MGTTRAVRAARRNRFACHRFSKRTLSNPQPWMYGDYKDSTNVPKTPTEVPLRWATGDATDAQPLAAPVNNITNIGM